MRFSNAALHARQSLFIIVKMSAASEQNRVIEFLRDSIAHAIGPSNSHERTARLRRKTESVSPPPASKESLPGVGTAAPDLAPDSIPSGRRSLSFS
jgi:hypothetical protein